MPATNSKYLLEPLLRYRRGKRRELLGRKHGIGRERWGGDATEEQSRIREQLEIVTVTIADMEIVDGLMRRECHDHAVASTKHRPEAVFREPGEGGGSRTLRHTTQEIQVISGGIRRSWQDLDGHTARLQLRDCDIGRKRDDLRIPLDVGAPQRNHTGCVEQIAQPLHLVAAHAQQQICRPAACKNAACQGRMGCRSHSGLDRERALGATLADEHCVGYRPTEYPLGPAHRQLEDCRRILLEFHDRAVDTQVRREIVKDAASFQCLVDVFAGFRAGVGDEAQQGAIGAQSFQHRHHM